MPSSIHKYACGALIFSSSLAQAQTPAPKPTEAPGARGGEDRAQTGREVLKAPKDEARGHFEKGVQFYERDAWEDALTEFRLSLDLHPTRAASVNAGLCLRKLGRFDEALELLEGLPLRFPNLSGQDRVEYDQEMEKLSKLVGALDLRGVAAGAHVWIDGRERGVTPLRALLRVASGSHRLRVTREGAEPVDETFEVRAGETVTVVVRANPARVANVPTLAVTSPIAPPPEVRALPPVLPSATAAVFALSIDVGVVVSPTLGGDIAGCGDPCRNSIAFGGRALAHASWALPDRPWTVSIDVGYLGLAQTIEDRRASVGAVGLRDEGTARDSLHLDTALVGASVAYRPTALAPLSWHAGIGALVGSVLDDRNGVFTSEPHGQHATRTEYAVSPAQRRAASYLYMSLGVAAGFHPAPRWWLGVEVEAMPLVALHQPTWDSKQHFEGPSGDSSFSSDSLTGRALILFTPAIGLRYEL